MAHIDVTHPHRLGLAGARRAAEEIARELGQGRGLHLEARWEGDTLHVSGSGFEGRLEARPEAVRVTARLSLLLWPMRRRIEQEVERYLAQYAGR